MRIIYCGTPDFAVPALKELHNAGHEIAAVVTQPDKPKGRSKKLIPSPVKEEALRLGIEVLQPERLKDPGVFEELEALRPELIVVAAFGQIVPKSILELPKYGCINIHASLLPAYRGAAPIQWAVLDGVEKTGVTIMQMNEGLDTGDMIAVREVPLADDETAGSLFDRLAVIGAQLLIETIVKIEKNEITRTPQPEKSTTDYARMIKKSDGQIDWSDPAEKIERVVRGMDPWPGAFTYLEGKSLKILKAAVIQKSPEEKVSPGTVLRLDKTGFHVMTGDGVLEISALQPEGKKPMDSKAFANGWKTVPVKLG